jgi:F0F1-type ATP synthase assembly protein I
MMWASRITGLGLEVALPTLAGYYIDGRYNSRPWATLAGTALGFTAGLIHLIQIAKDAARTEQRPR